MTRRPHGASLLNRSMMHAAARLHYLDDLSQLEVARRMQVSTATVSRLLALAREEGIVRIHVADLEETDQIGDTLCRHLKLRAVHVLESGKAAALSSKVCALLSGADLPAGATIAIGWGRTVQSVIAAGLPKIPGVVVVPTTGGMHETASHFQINEFARTAAEQMQGDACFLYAPSIVSPELRKVLARDRDTSQILRHWSRVDAAILGIGDFQFATSHRDFAFEDLGTDHVVGDVVRHYFDQDGQEVQWRGQENLMSISRDQLRRIPLSIGVAIGKQKVRAAIGAARSGMINALVTDTRLARAMLDDLERGAAEGEAGTAPTGSI
ncbi:sugar-binding transcriptional regulator [Jiella pelagia]|uniref:Sugar-binding transcriptional regulator n=1 Tax=Jiella pelagia TaxID=2986949 RepID=A0ABY7BZ49_9HYPH|nr:sugar-binding domain-containing protein [Jiella pelagia]WAP69104.1 sugar-binding transcriptional regulator [Jiella pelagia]